MMETSPEEGLFPPERILQSAELWYAALVIITFIAVGAIWSVITARSDDELDGTTCTGPDGKPLPITKKADGEKKKKKIVCPFGNTSRKLFQIVTILITLSFFVDFCTIFWHAFKDREETGSVLVGWWCGEARMIYVVGSIFVYLFLLITVFEWKDSPSFAHFAFWTVSWVGELVILVSTTASVSGLHHELSDVRQPTYELRQGPTPWDTLDIFVAVVRLVLITGLLITFVSVAGPRILGFTRPCTNDISETTPLLSQDLESQNGYGNGNGALDPRSQNGLAPSAAAKNGANVVKDSNGLPTTDQRAAFHRKDKVPRKTWYEYCRGYKVFFPYLWPSQSPRLQLVVFCCFILVLVQRVINVLVPAQTGHVTDLLADAVRNHTKNGTVSLFAGHPEAPEAPIWAIARDFREPLIQLLLLVGYRLLQGQSGLLGSLRTIMWIPVSQHTYIALMTAAFQHVHSLSLDFHLSKQTGEVLSALNKGASINTFLEQITFQVVPMLIDLFIGVTYLYLKFGSLYAMFVTVINFYYLYFTMRMAATRADQRRMMTNADRKEVSVKNDSIQSYETVKYFNAEAYEFDRYRDAVETFQRAEYNVNYGISQMNMVQSVVFMSGYLIAMMACGYEVLQGLRSVGDFVLLATYLNQMQGPLNFFGTFYRTVQSAMISGERLLELFKIRPTVVDQPNVKTLDKCEGHVRWNKVGFAYDRRKPALNELSFECKPGTTTAFVGESGGGKSTIFRLMFRYFDTSSGSIEIDGHDVKNLTIDSVRRFIGVVPQETILFNETLMYNLRYANQKATDADIYEACKAAEIHDRIMSFPDGYNTMVGERGMRLSGGEKQRVSIARTILKNPRVIMLDEATSALDGETEQAIQSRLLSGDLGQGRTLLIIAHRLSTITQADQILVLHNGVIAERGTHHELVAMKGRYASMWQRHCRAEQAVEEARLATDKAKILMRKAHMRAKKAHDSHSPTKSSGMSVDDSPSGSSSSSDNEELAHKKMT